MTVTV
ncbi:unnamed protein product [Gulo gulo]|jgi:hypothetical protein